MPDNHKVERFVDDLERGSESVVSAMKSKKYSDIGRGMLVPTKDVIRGVKNMHEAREGLFARVGQFCSIATLALVIIIIIRGVSL